MGLVQKGQMHPDVAAEILGTPVAALTGDNGAADKGRKRPLSSEPPKSEKSDKPEGDSFSAELDALFDQAQQSRKDSQLKLVLFFCF